MTTDSNLLKTSNKLHLYPAINSTQNIALFYACVSEDVVNKKRKKSCQGLRRDAKMNSNPF